MNFAADECAQRLVWCVFAEPIRRVTHDGSRLCRVCNVFDLAGESPERCPPSPSPALQLGTPKSFDGSNCDTVRARFAYEGSMRPPIAQYPSDESLMAAYVRGDAQAFQSLFAR